MPNPNDYYPPGSKARFVTPKELAIFTRLNTTYTVSLTLGPKIGDTAKDAKQIRPEPFVVRMITWATTGDTTLQSGGLSQIGGPSPQGRSVRVGYGDSFTTFLGQRLGLVSSVFGDSNGFLSLRRWIVFGGSQNLQIELQRLFFPGSPIDPEGFIPGDTRWDFTWHGVSLLPKGAKQSGSE
jgi:hypothetical protein